MRLNENGDLVIPAPSQPMYALEVRQDTLIATAAELKAAGLVPANDDAEQRHAKIAKKILDGCFEVRLNANDVWAWGVACDCVVEARGIPLLIEMVDKFGPEGEFAFMAEGEGMEPQEPWFTEGSLNKTKYLEAREYVRGKATHIVTEQREKENSDE